jgi:hypothetical protein
MTDDEVLAAILRAIEGLRNEHPPLAFGRVHERSVAHRLAVQMEPLFTGWNIDCEYDRDGLLKKLLDGIRECDGRSTAIIYPDIIVHHRNSTGRENNLLAIELKQDAAADACDRTKLELMTRQNGYYQYQLGLYVCIDGGNFILTWFKNGAQII